MANKNVRLLMRSILGKTLRDTRLRYTFLGVLLAAISFFIGMQIANVTGSIVSLITAYFIAFHAFSFPRNYCLVLGVRIWIVAFFSFVTLFGPHAHVISFLGFALLIVVIFWLAGTPRSVDEKA